jgi:hypothetical protein
MTSLDITTQLRATRPVAPTELRERVRAIAAQDNKPRAALPFDRLRVPRMRFALVPAAAALVLVSSAVVFGLARSGSPEVNGDLKAVAEDTGRSTESAPALAGPLATTPALGGGLGRAQRVTATLTVEVPDSDTVSDASQEALDLTRSLGGHIVNSSVATGDEGKASLTVRIPVARVQEAIVGLSSLGRITSQNVTIDDLQEGLDALERRAGSVRGQIARITARLETESLDAETRSVLEARRRSLRNELSQLRRGISTTNAEARLATVQLSIVTPGASGVAPVPSRLDRTIDEAVNILVWEGVVTLAMLVVAAPFMLALVALWLGRRLYRRQEERLLTAH